MEGLDSSPHTRTHKHVRSQTKLRGARRTKLGTTILKMTWVKSWPIISWFNYIFNTNLMHWLLLIHKILLSSTCFEPQVLIFRRKQLYTCSIWYCHSLWEFLVVCQYTAWVFTDRPPGTLIESDSAICCMYTTVSSWRWALEARNM